MMKFLDKSIIQVTKDLFIIRLAPSMKGYKNFISAWLYKSPHYNALVDVGPATTYNQLISSLVYLKIKHLDYIFLTHIHLDHAGAIGKVVNLFKDTIVFCHKTGVPHLINPKILWESSSKTLNEVARFYGKPNPVNNNTLFASEETFNGNSHGIKIINTPGHSSHHISVCIHDYLFLGEAAGVLIKFSSGSIYMRPATPPPLFMKTYLFSISLITRMLRVEPKLLCYSHLSVINSNYKTIELHCEQFELWVSIIKELMIFNEEKSEKSLIEECLRKLLLEDSFLHPIKQMNKHIRNRELFFIKNSIRGFIRNISKTK